MDIVRTFDDAVSFFAAYPTWVKLFGTGWFVVGVVWVATLVVTPKVEPVERWLPASDEATIKAFLPGDLFQDWKTKNEIANDLIRQRVKRVYTIGAAAAKIESQVKGAEVVHAETLENAIRKAHAAAQPGDIVLLAPACASFDQFKSYEHRGKTFKEIVRGLAAAPATSK